MVREIQELVPDRRHYVVSVGMATGSPKDSQLRCQTGRAAHGAAPRSVHIELEPGDLYLQLRRALRGKRVGLAPVLFSGSPHPLRAAAICFAPTKVLAYNRNLERHHLRLSIASFLFLKGVPLDRIFLRPSWLCPWKNDRTKVPDDAHVVDGRPLDPARPRVAVVSPYVPYP